MLLRFSWTLITLTALLLVPVTHASANGDTAKGKVIGWVEKGKIMPWGVVTKLKMDTGALTSSMQGDHIREFEKDGEKWVRFDVEVVDESTGKKVKKEFERKVLRKLKLSGAGGDDHRVSVLMDLCVGDTVYEEQFTLNDRTGFNYPVLIGRRTIEHLGYIDVSRTFTTEATCGDKETIIDKKSLEENPKGDK